MKPILALLMKTFQLSLLIATVSALSMTIQAQYPASPPAAPRTSAQPTRSEPLTQPPPTTVAARPADADTMDSIVAALYDVISGPAGKRDWDRFRSLFIPGARLIPTGPRPTGEVGSRVLSVDDYVQRAGALFEKEGFFEREASRQVERFGNIAHIFSTYESRHARDDVKPFQRGINSIQLMNDGKRWWVVTIFWQGEDEKNPIPAMYLRRRN
jgi:hypothetical protein